MRNTHVLPFASFKWSMALMQHPLYQYQQHLILALIKVVHCNIQLYLPKLAQMIKSVMYHVGKKFSLYKNYVSYAWNMCALQRNNVVVADVYKKLAKLAPYTQIHPTIITNWTFRHLDGYSNRVANYFHKQNYQKGDVVMLYTDYTMPCTGVWLGLSKLGVITAPLPANVTDTYIIQQCIELANPKAIICSHRLYQNLKLIESELKMCELYTLDDEIDDIKHLSTCLMGVNERAPPILYKSSFHDRILLLFNDSVNNDPRAGFMSNYRYLQMVMACSCLKPLDVESLRKIQSWNVTPSDALSLLMSDKNSVDDIQYNILTQIFEKIVRGKINYGMHGS